MGPSTGDLAELLSIMFAAVTVILVVLPSCAAFADAVAFARFPAHRVTPANSWVFFDRRFRSRLRRWVVVWILAAPVTGLLMAVVMMALGHSGGKSFTIGIQCASFTLTAVLLALAVVFALAPFKPSRAFTIPAALILTVALYAGIIIAGRLPPPTATHVARISQAYAPATLGMWYIYASLALAPTTAAAILFFYLFRRHLRLFREELEGFREGPDTH